MKKDFQWAVWLIIAIISILASSCGNQPTAMEKAQATRNTKDSIMAATYPYEWDRRVYNLVENSDGGYDTVRTSVWFNEEYIDVQGTIFDGVPGWVNKHTFVSDSVTIKVTPQTLELRGKRTTIRYGRTN